jgi:SAM-dependent methyltransferase
MKCRICENELNNEEIEVIEMMFGTRDKFRYCQCSACGCLQISDMPVNMGKYYPDNYYSLSLKRSRYGFLDRVNGYFKYKRAEYAVFGDSSVIGNVLYQMKPDLGLRALHGLNITKNTNVLDVGCGAGYQLHVLKEIGFKSLLGIDPYIEKDIVYENGLNILKKTVFDVEGQWDVIMMHHSFEHVWEQKNTMKRLGELLKKDGTLVIRVPVADSWAFKKYGSNWVQLDAPRHFYLHTAKSLGLLAESCGLKIERMVQDSMDLQFWGSERYVRGVSLNTKDNKLVKLFNFPKKLYYRWKASGLNKDHLGDQSVFYLKHI